MMSDCPKPCTLAWRISAWVASSTGGIRDLFTRMGVLRTAESVS